MTRAADIVIESPYAPDGEFGPVVEGPEADAWATARLAERVDFHYGISEPQFAAEAVAAAKGPAQATGQANYVPPTAKPPSEKALEKAADALDAALDLLMRSQRREEAEKPLPPKLAVILPLPVAQDAGEATEKLTEEGQP